MKQYTMFAIVLLNWWKRILGGISTIIIMTSVTAAAESPASVNLGTSGNFALLAKTGISVTGTASIVGDLGISPAAATYITGLGLIADASGTFSTSSLVTGKIFAADYTSPTPTNLTTAVADMETAYTDAAGRNNPDFTELYAGDITGKTMAPGIYKWSTGVLVSAGGATISGSASDVWIFQIAQNLELANGANITLVGGAQAANIFWQVAGQVTLGTTAAIKGIILCQTAIVFGTGATLSGSALAQTAITMDANAVTIPEMVPVVVQAHNSTARNPSIVQTYHNRVIEFIASSNGTAIVRMLNVRGQNLMTLFDGEVQAGKRNRIQMAAKGLAKGCYLSLVELNGKKTFTKLMQID